MPNTPRLKEGQKIRVADHVADELVNRGVAEYDVGKEAVTDDAKKEKEEKEVKKEKKEKKSE